MQAIPNKHRFLRAHLCLLGIFYGRVYYELLRSEKIVEFDIEAIKKAGYDTITRVLVTNSYDYKNVLSYIDRNVKEKEELLKAIK